MVKMKSQPRTTILHASAGHSLGNRPALGVWHCHPTKLAAEAQRIVVQFLSVVLAITVLTVSALPVLTLLLGEARLPRQISEIWAASKGAVGPSLTVVATVLVAIGALIARWIFLTARRYANKLVKGTFHVSIALKSNDAKAVSGTIRSATEEDPWPLVSAVSGDPYDINGPQASVLQTILPALYRLQEASGGLIDLSGNATAWNFQFRRELTKDFPLIVSILISIVAAAGTVLALITASPNSADAPMWSAICICLLAVASANFEHVSYRLNLPASLYLRTEARPSNVMYAEWTEHHGWYQGTHKHWMVISNDQGFAEFCKRVAAMKSTVRMRWQLEVEPDPYEIGATATHYASPAVLRASAAGVTSV